MSIVGKIPNDVVVEWKLNSRVSIPTCCIFTLIWPDVSLFVLPFQEIDLNSSNEVSVVSPNLWAREPWSVPNGILIPALKKVTKIVLIVLQSTDTLDRSTSSYPEFMRIPIEFGEYDLTEGTLYLISPPSITQGTVLDNFALTLTNQPALRGFKISAIQNF